VIGHPSQLSTNNSLDANESQLLKRAINNGVKIKILPLGASITWGTASSDGNGYRERLGELIKVGGNDVLFVGTKNNGDMANNNNEGYPGLTIRELTSIFQKPEVLAFKPNVITIHLGTNDCIRPEDPAGAPGRMSNLIDVISNALPKTVMIISTLVPNRDKEACIQTLNSGFRTVITDKRNAGLLCFLLELHGSDWSMADISGDGTHPTDSGYQKMGTAFYNGIAAAGSFITPPDPSGVNPVVDTNTQRCDKTPRTVRGPVKIQKGSGTDDGPYKHKSVSRGRIFDTTNFDPQLDGAGVILADIDGDGEYLL
jgi:lysophospholipase L1-like esterase